MQARRPHSSLLQNGRPARREVHLFASSAWRRLAGKVPRVYHCHPYLRLEVCELAGAGGTLSMYLFDMACAGSSAIPLREGARWGGRR